MNRRADQHLVKIDHGTPRAAGQCRYTFWCGDGGDGAYDWNKPAKDENAHYCCRKCNAEFFRAKLEVAPTRFRINGKNLTEDEKDALGQRWRWRHMWPVRDVEDREWGWIAMEGGWGERWQFVTWSPRAPIGDELTGKIGAPISDGRGNAKTFSSKEAVLYQFPALIAQHSLRDKATQIAEAAEGRAHAKAESARWDLERAEADRLRGIRQAERDAQRAAELAGLRSILETFGPALSNLERVGLMAAIERWAK